MPEVLEGASLEGTQGRDPGRKIMLFNLRFQVAWAVDYNARIRTFSFEIYPAFFLYQH